MTYQSAKSMFCLLMSTIMRLFCHQWFFYCMCGIVQGCLINLRVYTYSIISVPYSRRSWQSALPPAAAERQQMSASVPASPPCLPTLRSAPALCPATHFFTSSTLFVFYFSFSLFSLLSCHFCLSILRLVLGLCFLFWKFKTNRNVTQMTEQKWLGIPQRR